jgi:hypothetical protein
MVAYTPVRMAQASLANAAAVVYTVPAGQSAIVKQVIVANTTTVTVAAFVRLVAAGGVGAATNDIVSNVDIPAKSVLVFDLSQVLPVGGTVVAYASVASVLVATISGLVFA